MDVYLFINLLTYVLTYTSLLYTAAGLSYTMIPQESAPPEYRNETNGRDVGLFVIRKTVESPAWDWNPSVGNFQFDKICLDW